ncbi:MAG: transposase [Patescibacteria group bacterium]
MDIFSDSADYSFFLSRLEEYLFPNKSRRAPSAERYERKSFPENSFSLLCYCLMPNHYHLAIKQNSELPISALMLSLTTGYSKYFNKKYRRVGSLFQDQFKAVHIDSNEQLLWVSAYIHQNPRTAQLVKDPGDYKYSSYSEYTGQTIDKLCDTDLVLGQFSEKVNYQQFVTDSLESIVNRKGVEGALL